MKDDNWQQVMDLYAVNGITWCMYCMVRSATAVHEIVPRSKRPKDWDAIDNRVPLCQACHALIHRTGTSKHARLLRVRRALYCDVFDIILPFDT